MRLWQSDDQGEPAYPCLAVPLLGDHQLENAANAVMALEALRAQGLALSRATIAAGIAQVQWPGRFEVLQRDPALVVDGAHNVDSMQKLLRTVRAEFPGQDIAVVFGAGQGHLPADLLAALAGPVVRVHLARADHPKATEVSELAAAAAAAGLEATTSETVSQALALALATVRENEIVLVTGSLFVVAEARRAWVRMQGLPELPSDPPDVY